MDDSTLCIDKFFYDDFNVIALYLDGKDFISFNVIKGLGAKLKIIY